MGILALAALGAVLGTIFLVGLVRLRFASGPGAGAAPSTMPARPPSLTPATAPSLPGALDGPIEPLPPVSAPSIQAIELPAEKARLSGHLKLDTDPVSQRPHPHHRPGSPPEPPAVHQAITNFHDEGDAAEWSATIPKPGLYEIDLVYASPGPKDKSESCLLSVGDQDLHADTLHTRGRDAYQVLTVGNLTLTPGPLTLRFRLSEKTHASQLRLRTLRLIPAT